MRKHSVKSAAIVGATLLVVAACGSNKEEGGTAGGSCDTSKGTLTVGVVAPLSGNLSALGIGIIGQYLGRVYAEIKQRPIYIVRQTFGGK